MGEQTVDLNLICKPVYNSLIRKKKNVLDISRVAQVYGIFYITPMFHVVDPESRIWQHCRICILYVCRF